MTALVPGGVTDAIALPLSHSPLDADLVVSGTPTTGYAELESTEAGGIGIWEHTPGVSRDVEADEVFVVLAGDATVHFDHPAIDPIELRPGSVVRLTAGMRTVWTVRETLRKVYIAG